MNCPECGLPMKRGYCPCVSRDLAESILLDQHMMDHMDPIEAIEEEQHPSLEEIDNDTEYDSGDPLEDYYPFDMDF